MELTELQRLTTSSIEIKFNAKRDYEWSIKRYYDASNPIEMVSALDDLKLIDERLRAEYLPKGE